MRMVDHHESDEVCNGAPDQIHDAVPHLHIVLTVDRTGRLPPAVRVKVVAA